MVDYAHMEAENMHRLQAGERSNFLGKVRAVLVDEYEDTNLLQEQIYMELARACGGALTVVGDDDQSLYRFRGATVELFSNFPDRTAAAGGTRSPSFCKPTTDPHSESSSSSTPTPDSTPPTRRSAPRTSLPCSPATTPPPASRSWACSATPLTSWPKTSPGSSPPSSAATATNCPAGRSFDAHPTAATSGTPPSWPPAPAKPAAAAPSLLPGLLRQELRRASAPIDVFNPRGQQLHRIPVVEAFGGALLSCLDPGAAVESATFLPPETRNGFGRWRAAIDADLPRRDRGLRQLLRSWVTRTAQPGWPRNASALELIYAVTHYFPELHDDPEGQVYLEAFTRQLSACEQVSPFGGRVVKEQDASRGDQKLTLAERSVKDLLQDFLGPIAGGSVDVNEDLLEDFPHDRLPVLSIHQAKGLEFPIAIVDVGASFKKAHPSQRFKRSPPKAAVRKPWKTISAATRR